VTPDKRPPNLVIFVLDCVSAEALRARGAETAPAPAYDSFAAEGLSFRTAVTTAPWTIPAHASLFTGLYPWRHKTFNHGSPGLDSNIPTLAGLLRAAGYRSTCLSANPFVSPRTGLTSGFDDAVWSEWTHLYFRGIRNFHRYSPPSVGSGSPIGAEEPRRWRRFPRSIRRFAERYPPSWEIACRAAGKLLGPGDRSATGVASWIEPAFEEALRAGGRSAHPTFTFVNLLDAHEPYIGMDVHRSLYGEYLSMLGVRQDWVNWLRGRWAPNSRELRKLRTLYGFAITTVDRRLQRLLSIVRKMDLWEQTMIVITSDHGQCFTEGRQLFHSVGLDESVVKIPLAVKLPYGRLGKVRASGAASLVDILPSALLECGASPPSSVDGVTFDQLIDHDRVEPALVLGDGLSQIDSAHVTSRRREELDSLRVDAYSAYGRVGGRILAGDGEASYRRGSGPLTDEARIEKADENGGKLESTLDLISIQVKTAVNSVHQRIAGWGYD